MNFDEQEWKRYSHHLIANGWLVIFGGRMRYLAPLVCLVFSASMASALTVTHKNLDLVFGFPEPGKSSDDSLEKLLIDYLEGAVAGSVFRGSFYKPESLRVADAVVAAAKRGVDVKIVFDDSINERKHGKFRSRILNNLRPDQYHICSGGACIGSANNHNKFFIFSEVRSASGGGNVHDVVLSSSMNFSDSQMRKHNNTVVVRNDTAMFRLFLNYSEDLFQERKNPDYLNGANGKGDGSGEVPVRAYFYPTSGPAEPVLDELKAATCRMGGGQIRLIHSLVAGQYALDTIRELQRLKGEGCDVALIVRSNSSDNHWVDELKKSGLKVHWKGIFSINIHSKYMAIRAQWPSGGSLVRKEVVFTGSANLKSQSYFENDETVLRIEAPEVYQAFISNWTEVSKQ